MDHQSVSNYGWLVIVAVILIGMLALAPVFINYISEGVNNTLDKFDNVADEAISEAINPEEAPTETPTVAQP